MGQDGRGIGMLAAAIDDRIRERTEGREESALLFDFADVLEDFSLLPNTYPQVVPLKDYSACKNAGKHHYGCQACIDAKLKHCGWEPPPPPQIKPGDRVLIVWVQKQPVVVDVVTSGEKIVKGP